MIEKADRAKLQQRVQELLSVRDSFQELEDLLASNSYLPGPRGNLELADVFAHRFAAAAVGDAHWSLLRGWIELSAKVAPTNDPREFLPFCALQAMGASYFLVGKSRQEEIVRAAQASAEDGRWRIREGVAMAFQRIAEGDFSVVRLLLSGWIEKASLLQQRAILAALAHPPVLKEAENARYCLEVSDRILDALPSLQGDVRKGEPFRVLRLGLEYALSVFVAALPEEGFAFLRRWAQHPDPDIKRIVKSNANKGRLSKKYPEEVDRVLDMMTETTARAS